jgi:hypothetical protein
VTTGTISVLSLVVAIVAVFVGPFVARANVQRQIQVAVREAWMREFREQVAGFLSSFAAYREKALWLANPDIAWRAEDRLKANKERLEANDAMRRHFHAIRLLIAEKGPQYAAFIPTIRQLLQAPADQVTDRAEELTSAAAQILQHERAAIDVDPWWRAVAAFGVVGWWSQIRAWLSRDPPKWPT